MSAFTSELEQLSSGPACWMDWCVETWVVALSRPFPLNRSLQPALPSTHVGVLGLWERATPRWTACGPAPAWGGSSHPGALVWQAWHKHA